MSASDRRRLQHQTTIDTLPGDEVAQRTFWSTLAGGIVVIAIISLFPPPAGPTRKSMTVRHQSVGQQPVHELIARQEIEAKVPAPAALPSTVAGPTLPPTVEPLPPEPTSVVAPTAPRHEIAQAIPSQPELLPDSVPLPEETAPAPLVVAEAVVPSSLIAEPEVVSIPPEVAPTPVVASTTESESAPQAADGGDVKVASAGASDQGIRIESGLKSTTRETIVRFRGRQYTLTCPHCGGQQSESADCIAEHCSFRCLSCAAKIKVRELHERLEDEQKQLRKLARR
jgi:hypothetical protein